MKKILLSIIFIVALAAFFHYGEKLSRKTQELTENLSNSPALQELKREVFTSGPLRNYTDAPTSKLTVTGTIYWTNQQRGQNNLPALKENLKLTQAAQLKVKDMFDKQYFEHISPQGVGPAGLAETVGYDYIAIGENLALGNFKDDQALVEAWMNSPGHRANILSSKFTEIGVAVGRGLYEGKMTWLAVQEFGKPASACPSVSVSLKTQISSYQSDLNVLEPQIARLKAELEAMDPKTKQEYDEYNQKVAQYNALVKQYNNKVDVLKGLVAQYNAQVSVYNTCVDS